MNGHDMPKPYSSIVDAVNARDREYFEAHPKEDFYLRPYVPGEAWPRHPKATEVRVVRGPVGIRVRLFQEQ